MICFWLSSHFCAEFVVAGARCGTGSTHSVSTVLSGTVCSERYLCQRSVVCMVCKPPEMTCVKYFLVELYSLTHSFWTTSARYPAHTNNTAISGTIPVEMSSFSNYFPPFPYKEPLKCVIRNISDILSVYYTLWIDIFIILRIIYICLYISWRSVFIMYVYVKDEGAPSNNVDVRIKPFSWFYT